MAIRTEAECDRCQKRVTTNGRDLPRGWVRLTVHRGDRIILTTKIFCNLNCTALWATHEDTRPGVMHA